jgi:16S rRNA (cytidine1402-2'-O)-methyltransferase
MSAGTLYLVATPIGNLEDLSLRALRILREVPRIACEDTRHTRRLLLHYKISTPTISFHRFNEHQRVRELLERLLSGEDLALVTDAGTPSISDPGFTLARAASQSGIPVIPVPGPSAVLCALVASGLPAERFLFLGFLPHRLAHRRRLLASLRDDPSTLVFFDSPRRVKRSLRLMEDLFGDRRAALCREMTKLHEEYRRGRLRELAESLPENLKGEVTVIVEGAPTVLPSSPSLRSLRREVEEAVRQGSSRRDAVREVARRHRVSRSDLYRISQAAPEVAAETKEGEEEE